MKAAILSSFVLILSALPCSAGAVLFSRVSAPLAITEPRPAIVVPIVDRNDNLPNLLEVSAGGYSVSAFAQSDFGVLRASVYNSIGVTAPYIYPAESFAMSEFSDDLFLTVPLGFTSVRLMFGLEDQLSHDPNNISGGEALHFAASMITRPGNGIGLLGTANCDTSAQNTAIPGSATCVLTAPVTPGQSIKLELNAFMVLFALGREGISGINASHTAAVTSTGWVSDDNQFTPAAFTGVSGSTYAFTEAVPEPGTVLLVASALCLVALRRLLPAVITGTANSRQNKLA